MTNNPANSAKPVRHILSLSGGKDSTALAIYMRDRIPDVEYVFCDTEKELPETYEYLARVEAYLGKPLTILKHDGRDFDHHLAVRFGYLPSPKMRWCTELLKLRPFERHIGDDPVVSYIGIRADEDRKGYISHKPNIQTRYPFIEDGLKRDDIIRILEESGLGLPKYYSWRSRSGCYFCFFQQKIEWVGLLENHPDLFWEAARYETDKDGATSGENYTWSQGESLAELAHPERIAHIKEDNAQRLARFQRNRINLPLVDVFDDLEEEERACLICDL